MTQPQRSYQGYYRAGHFRTRDGTPVPQEGDAILSFLNAEPPSDAAKERLAAFDEFMAAMHACPEEFPEFERAQLHREAAL